MSNLRYALLGLAIAPLALAGDGKPDTALAASVELKIESHPLRGAIGAKQAGDSLKPALGKAEFHPVDVALRMHSHADGSHSFACDAEHEPSAAQARTEDPSGDRP